MDVFPAGPACPGPRRPALSVVIPVRDGGRDLERCLRGLRASCWTDYELIVVDDGSTDDSADLAAAAGARVLRHGRPLGPAAARNAGVQAATADFVFFLDADVVPHRETLTRALAHFGRHPELSALFGSYDSAPAARGVVSQFRNLLHHFVHQDGAFAGEIRPAHTFWTGCGVIRRDVFGAVGGFDPTLYRRPAIEDIELGYRLTRAGHEIALARDVLVTHLKRWTLASMVRTDILQRGVPWTLLLLRSGVAESDLNVRPDQRLCVLANAAGLIGLALAPVVPAAAALFLLNLLVLAVVNRRFYRFLARVRGPAFVIPGFALHYVYYLCCGVSVAIALALHARSRRAERAAARRPAPGVRVDRAGAEVPARSASRRRLGSSSRRG
jgi:glycosyltransferase involved in cell wall biosynthesis